METHLSSSGDTADQGGPEDKLQVLLWMANANRVSGGHIVQLEETARALGAYGVEATVCFDNDPDLAGIDLVHGFDLQPVQVHECRDRGLPVLISPIYWDVRYGPEGFADLTVRSFLGRLRRAATFSGAAMTSRSRLSQVSLEAVWLERNRIALFEAADHLLPNSEGEAESIRRDLDVSTPMTAVPNAVNPERFDQPGLPFAERDTVLYVGRIDPHKNQLALINAMKGTDKRLVLVGYDHPDHPEYVRACRKAGAGWVEFAGGQAPDDLPPFFASARVHVVPSWFETTGLVSLEAALSGCSLVTTDRGHARAYLGDRALYCDPADGASIRRAVDAAWDREPGPEIRRHVLDNFTWDHTARATADVYRRVLKGRDRSGRGEFPR